VIVFLLLGAIVNVAVAWGFALQAKAVQSEWEELIPEQLQWPEYIVQAKWPPLHAGQRIFAGCGVDRYLFEAVVTENWSIFLDVDLFGWPSRSMELHSVYPAGVSTSPDEAPAHPLHQSALSLAGHLRGIGVSESLGSNVRLPLAIRPLGFAINTIFYAAILWLGWVAPGKVRRLVRVRQHRCPACGFIIAPGTCANGLCSECGATLPWMTKAST
jgi:hypothetical protein